MTSRRLRYALWGGLLLTPWQPVPAPAHTLGLSDLGGISWNTGVWLWCSLGLSLALYWRGAFRLHQLGRSQPGRVASFSAGWLGLVAALVSPIDAAGGLSFAAHMVQHELLMIVAAPLLIAGRPARTWLWSLPAHWRKPVGRWFGRQPAWGMLRRACRPLPAWIIHCVAVWGWHVPFCFQAALRHEAVHLAQHASFFLSALLFWWSILARWHHAEPDRGALFYLFSTMMHTSALGALLALSAQLWYPAYGALPWQLGLSPLEDQQLGGLIMWIPGALSYVIVALVLCARWLMGGEREALPRP
ncbi:cytochrome c oxidase assembly protein [Herbaspirillum rubrisubalbicans]|uniref:cytochrome c oxidase assembly protein n=1 Tax=Herbaspirillum rubrisubalbicans TaxID=80842 RepID=UPI000DD43D67|nr:cytochrome c oxidase assembly protein [Herbaspirillum rubrisubalbicans]